MHSVKIFVLFCSKVISVLVESGFSSSFDLGNLLMFMQSGNFLYSVLPENSNEQNKVLCLHLKYS